MTEYHLPPKLLPAIHRLHSYYKREGETDLRVLLESSRFHFELGTEHEVFDDVFHAHDIVAFVPRTLIDLEELEDRKGESERICDDLNNATREVQNERVRAVYFKPADESDARYQNAIPFKEEPFVDPNTVGLWKENHLRIFLSHQEAYKSEAYSLATTLEPYGFSVFVAHDKIKPMKDWQQEIRNGLRTMEVMLVLVTDDLHKSYWSNQEIGFALASETPIVCVKVGSIEPQGFIGSQQAIEGSLEHIEDVAPEVSRALINEIDQGDRRKEVLIEAFISSVSYFDAMDSLERLKETVDYLNDAQLNQIIEGYARNDQLYSCIGIHSKGKGIKEYLEDATGKKFEYKDNKILEIT